MTSLRQRFIEDMQIRNLSVHTQRCYVLHVSLFARHFQKSPELLGPEHIRAYQVYLTNEKKLATGSIASWPSQRFVFCTELRSRKTGPSQTSSQLPKCPRHCRSCSARKK